MERKSTKKGDTAGLASAYQLTEFTSRTELSGNISTTSGDYIMVQVYSPGPIGEENVGTER